MLRVELQDAIHRMSRHRERFRKATGAVAFLRTLPEDEPACVPATPAARPPSLLRRLVPRGTRRAVPVTPLPPATTAVRSKTASPEPLPK